MGWSVSRPSGLTFHQAQLSFKGYTLVTPHGGDAVYLLDMDGRVVHRWVFAAIVPDYARLLPNGHLLVRGTDVNLPPPPPDEPTRQPPKFEQHVRRLRGSGTHLLEVDWLGEVQWHYINPFQHHDFIRLDNGNTLFPEWVELSDHLHARVKGGMKRPRERLPKLLGDDIVEIDPTGAEIRRIEVWKFLDPGKDPIGPLDRRWEWTHLNGIDVNAHGDIVFSCRQNNRVGIIDGTTSDLRWKYTNASWPDNPTFVGDDNVQVFVNNRWSSSILEVDPTTDDIVWQYEASPPEQFFSGHISGAERLPNDSVLICEGASGRLFEVTADRQVVWEWINPFNNTDREGRKVISFDRGHRYSSRYPGLADRDLNPRRFRNLNRIYGLMD